MKRRKKQKTDEQFQKNLGKRIEAQIKLKGFKSIYDFWIQKAGDNISRAGLNYIVSGKTDIKITTLRMIARLLDVKTKDLLDFE